MDFPIQEIKKTLNTWLFYEDQRFFDTKITSDAASAVTLSFTLISFPSPRRIGGHSRFFSRHVRGRNEKACNDPNRRIRFKVGVSLACLILPEMKIGKNGVRPEQGWMPSFSL